MAITVHLVMYDQKSQDPEMLKGILDVVHAGKTDWSLQVDVMGVAGVSSPLRIPQGDAALGILAGPRVLSTFEKLRCPKVVVYLNGPCALTGVEVEETRLANAAARHLRERGYASFVFFYDGENPSSPSMGRAFQEELPGSEVFTEGRRLRRKGAVWSLDLQIRDLADLLKSLPLPVGVLCMDLEHGARVIRAADLAGLKIPFQLGVVVLDSRTDLCTLMQPSLTQVMRPSRQIGREAARLMDDRLQDRVPDGTRIPMPEPSLIVRASTSVWVSDSGLLDRMQELLTEKWEWNREPERIAEALGVTRRTLDRHCEKSFGLTFSGHLERMRVEKTLLALRTRPDPLSELCLDMGYSSQSHMTVALKQATGKTPGQIRKEFL